jgi:hypothetical protein
MELTAFVEKTVDLNEGDMILIPCADVRDVNSKRTRLFRIRMRLAQRNPYFSCINIQTQQIEDKLFIALVRPKSVDAMIIRSDGSVENVSTAPQEYSAVQRIVHFAIQDKLNVESLLETLGDLYSEQEIREEYAKQLTVEK